ncbi:helix-turn-helix domain-containing protein [Oscillospiraceae bacterium NTUH-002-81]|nr:helix-turn-helix domain-containing protein [Oscillospiraceae bacterium NTUH-002-81]
MTETNKTAAATAPTPPVLPACPVETTLTLISDKWKVLILRDLLSGTKRFGELKKSIGHVTQKVLTAQLRQMEESGLLTRTVYAEVPPRVEYTLTELGYSLKPILDAMLVWGENYKKKVETEWGQDA